MCVAAVLTQLGGVNADRDNAAAAALWRPCKLLLPFCSGAAHLENWTRWRQKNTAVFITSRQSVTRTRTSQRREGTNGGCTPPKSTALAYVLAINDPQTFEAGSAVVF